MSPAGGKRVVITGASRGLGLAMTAGFAQRECVVCGCARSEQAVATLRERWPAPHRFDVVDVTDDPGVRAWAAAVVAAGTPDLLINNAALINRPAPLWQVPAEEFSAVIDVNIKGVANVLRHFLPTMVEQRRGVIVNFSSGWGRSTSPEVAPYCATKFAVEGLTQALAQELPAGMAAVALNPGVIQTEMLQTTFGDDASKYPTPEQWARRAVPFLLGLGPRNNGHSLTVD